MKKMEQLKQFEQLERITEAGPLKAFAAAADVSTFFKALGADDLRRLADDFYKSAYDGTGAGQLHLNCFRLIWWHLNGII